MKYFIIGSIIGLFVGPLSGYLAEKFYVKYKIHKIHKQVSSDIKTEDINKNDLEN